MSYKIHQRGGSFLLKGEHRIAALALINAQVPSWGWEPFQTLDEALMAQDWLPTTDPRTGDITELAWEGESKYGLERTDFLVIIQHLVEPGSHLDMFGDDGSRWSWVFTGQEVQTIED